MSSSETPQKTIALIHSSALPFPLGTISVQVAEYSRRVCFHGSSSEYVLKIIDIAIFNIPVTSAVDGRKTPSDDATGPDPCTQKDTSHLTEWHEEASKHVGLIFLFPFHIWSYCNPIKDAITALPQTTFARKPVIMMGFGKQVKNCGKTWRKSSYSMMREFLEGTGMKVIDIGWGNPEFAVHAGDYEECWQKGRAVISGQQSEEWESPAWNRCEEGMKKMIEILKSQRKT
jgi:NAD(P)H-dependent FMN reductase